MTKVLKNTLFALFCALAFVPVSAQKTIPQSLQPYVVSLNPKVTKALKQAGFDLSASAKESPSIQQRFTALQLDSTKTFFGYDFVGTEDTIPFQRAIYQYPQPKVQIETDDQFEDNAWQQLSRSKTLKDNQDRIVEVLAEEFDAAQGDYVPDSRAILFPHDDSPVLIDSFFVYGWDTAATDWALIFYTTNQYDAQNRLVTSISSFDYLGQPLLFKDVYTYNAKGDNTLVESFALFDVIEVLSGRRELEYKNHLLTQEVDFAPDGLGGFASETKITYTYTGFDKQSQVHTYKWSLDANDWVQTQKVTYGHDSEHRIDVQETIVYEQDGTETRDLTKYAYAQGDQLAMESNHYLSGTTYFLSDRKFYYYSNGTSSAPEPAALSLVLAPNPTTGFVQLQLGEPSLVRIYNTQGEMVNSGEYQPNQLLNLCDLPNGLYFVSAQSANAAYSGRLVKQ